MISSFSMFHVQSVNVCHNLRLSWCVWVWVWLWVCVLCLWLITFLIESQQEPRCVRRGEAERWVVPLTILIAIAMSTYNYTCLRFIISKQSKPEQFVSWIGVHRFKRIEFQLNSLGYTVRSLLSSFAAILWYTCVFRSWSGSKTFILWSFKSCRS